MPKQWANERRVIKSKPKLCSSKNETKNEIIVNGDLVPSLSIFVSQSELIEEKRTNEIRGRTSYYLITFDEFRRAIKAHLHHLRGQHCSLSSIQHVCHGLYQWPPGTRISMSICRRPDYHQPADLDVEGTNRISSLFPLSFVTLLIARSWNPLTISSRFPVRSFSWY